LTSGLATEYERWKESVTILNERILQLVGDVFIASACICYYGPFEGTYRENLVTKWEEKCLELALPVGEKFDI